MNLPINEYLTGESNYTSKSPGAIGGFKVTLNAQQDEYFIASSQGAGFRVSKHPLKKIQIMNLLTFFLNKQLV